MSPAGPRAARPWDRWSARGVIADLDGVLLDSADVLRTLWGWWAHRIGADREQVATFAAGRRPTDVVGRFAADRNLEAELLALRHRGDLLLRACPRVPGVRSFVRAIPGHRFAVVTGLDGNEALGRLRRARIPQPQILVTGDELSAGRPDPSGHERAVGRLGLEPDELIAIESSVTGLEAAKELGMNALMVGLANARNTRLTGIVCLRNVSRLRVTVEPDGLTLQATREPADWR